MMLHGAARACSWQGHTGDARPLCGSPTVCLILPNAAINTAQHLRGFSYAYQTLYFLDASIDSAMREIGGRLTLNLWGSVYPRGGFLHQADDHKAAAVVAQRAGDIVTRRGQLHVYQPLLANSRPGYWPAGALKESDASTGKWQELTPRLSNTCAVFPHGGFLTQAQQGDYAWALWRPYSCCQRRGQVFLGSTDFM